MHLPRDFVSGSVLRLRGQGEAKEGCRAGDLYVEVTVTVSSPPIAWAWAVAAGLIALSTLAWWLVR